jgi:hypothetical protein
MCILKVKISVSSSRSSESQMRVVAGLRVNNASYFTIRLCVCKAGKCLRIPFDAVADGVCA